RGTADKKAVVSLVERGGQARSFHVANVSGPTLGRVIRENVDMSARLMTDEWKSYKLVGKEMADHQTVAHSYGEYVRGDAYTNTVEGFFSILKRGVDGTYHHIS